MTYPLSRTLRALALATLYLGATGSSAQTNPLPTHDAVPQTPQSPQTAGDLIYRGDTYAQRASTGAPLFRYERRVHSTPSGLVASHTTRDASGGVLIVESSVMTSSYDVQRFEVANQQTGFTASVEVSKDGRRLDYTLNDNGKISQATESISDPVVCGPSLFGFILKHWSALQSGSSMAVRMVVPKEKTSYGFDIKFDTLVNGQAVFSITPSSFVIRLAIAPLKVVFDANTKAVVRYEGRVPPMERVSGKLKDLDARVEYTQVAASYR